MGGISPDAGFPYSDDSKATDSHIGVLRLIQVHTTPLTLRGIWKFVRVSVPVIAVELDDRFCAWNEGVDAKASAYKLLALVPDVERFKHRVSKSLQIVRPHRGLTNIHFDEARGSGRIKVSAPHRTISRVAFVLARFRPFKFITARLAEIGILTSGLPLIRVFLRAEKVLRLSSSRDRNDGPANGAWVCLLKPCSVCVTTLSGTSDLVLASSCSSRLKQLRARHAFLLGTARCNSLALKATAFSRYCLGAMARELRGANETSELHPCTLAQRITRRMGLVYSGRDERARKLAKVETEHGLPLFGGASA